MRVRVRERNGREWKGDEDEDEEEVVGEVMCCEGKAGEGRRDAA